MSISDLVANKIWEIAQQGNNKFKKLEVARKKHIILGGITLAVGLGLAFSFFADSIALAKNQEKNNGQVAAEIVDPLNKINKGFANGFCDGLARNASHSDAGGECPGEQEELVFARQEAELNILVGRHPITAMVPFIVKRDKKVASFLVAIAKKESDWGKHTPKKNGRECYNFWGYRGKENTTASGYSCFDSPEHAVKVVGNRVEKLIGQKINTPAKMVVWKCGRDCEAAGGQAAANKWISDVAHVYQKLQS